jgi:S-adenosylhomocysteine hydrolase
MRFLNCRGARRLRRSTQVATTTGMNGNPPKRAGYGIRILRARSLICRVKSKTHLGIGTAGVVGNGYIGQAVSDGLRAAGVDVFVYDRDDSRLSDDGHSNCETLEELYSVSDTIWGCTGSDHLAGHNWLLEKNKILISCSSKDFEFRSALERINEQPQDKYTSRLSDVKLITPSGSIQILGGGFPINFTGTSEIESAQDIQFTRALLFSGVLQVRGSISTKDW